MSPLELIQAAAENYAIGNVVKADGFTMIDHDIWVRQEFNSTTTQLDFFSKSADDTGANHPFCTNLNANMCLDNAYFVMEGLGFAFEEGIDLTDGSAVAAGSPAIATASGTASTTAIDQGKWIDLVMGGGLVNLTIAQKNLIRNQYGLKRFPSAGGLSSTASVYGAGAGNTALIDRAVVFQNNGVEHVANLRTFRRKFVLGPNTNISLLVQWQKALALATPINIFSFFRGMLFSLN